MGFACTGGRQSEVSLHMDSDAVVIKESMAYISFRQLDIQMLERPYDLSVNN